MASIIVGNANNMFLEEIKAYLEDKIDCKIDIAGNMIVGAIDDEAIRAYSTNKLNESAVGWLKGVHDSAYNWSD